MKRSMSLAVPALALALALTGCGGTAESTPAAETAEATVEPTTEAPEPTTEAPEPEPTEEEVHLVDVEPNVGEPFLVPMGNGNVAKITVVSAERVDALNHEFAVPPVNGGFLILDVLWETEVGETSANPFYFTARDADGRAGEADLFSDGLLGVGQVAVGDKLRGTVIFDVTPSETLVMITDPLMQEAARLVIP